MSTRALYLASPARLMVAPARQEVHLGQTATVDIKVEDVDDLYGFEVHLAFDPAKVQVQEPILMGNLFEGRVVQTFQNRVDNWAGTVDFAGALQAERQGISGDGTLFRLVVKGMGEGTSGLTFRPNTALADSQARLISLETQGGVMNVMPVQRLYLPLVTVQRQS